ncbi:hypothetical protein [Gluconobacter japonicus]|uniref:hypothetical protein n=1 Tax=Gluconobacter japonicus TaxID=376620 RepID=UPI0039E8F3C3
MRREQKLLLAFCALVFIPVGIVWFVAWPLIHAWKFPPVTEGKIVAPVSRDLTSAEVSDVNLWLQSHTTGWGPSGEQPPQKGQVILRLSNAENHPIIISIWKHKHEADIVGVQLEDDGPYRMNAFEDASLKALQPAELQPHG